MRVKHLSPPPPLRVGSTALAFAWALSATAASAAGAPVEFLICQPGGAELKPEHQSTLATLYRYLEKRTGLAEGQIAGSFLVDEAECRAALAKKPAMVLASLPLFLEMGAELTPVAQPILAGKTTDTYSVLVGLDGPTELAKLAGKKLTGTAIASKAFLARVALDGKLGDEATLGFQPERLALRAIRGVANGEVDALLVDGGQLRALKGTKFEAKLKVVYTSEPLPNAPVTVRSSAGPKGWSEKLKDTLVKMRHDPEAQALLATFQLDGFAPIEGDAWAAVRKKLGR